MTEARPMRRRADGNQPGHTGRARGGKQRGQKGRAHAAPRGNGQHQQRRAGKDDQQKTKRHYGCRPHRPVSAPVRDPKKTVRAVSSFHMNMPKA